MAQNAKELGWDGRSDFGDFISRTDFPQTSERRRAQGIATRDDISRSIRQGQDRGATQLRAEAEARNRGFVNQSNQRENNRIRLLGMYHPPTFQ